METAAERGFLLLPSEETLQLSGEIRRERGKQRFSAAWSSRCRSSCSAWTHQPTQMPDLRSYRETADKSSKWSSSSSVFNKRSQLQVKTKTKTVELPAAWWLSFSAYISQTECTLVLYTHINEVISIRHEWALWPKWVGRWLMLLQMVFWSQHHCVFLWL